MSEIRLDYYTAQMTALVLWCDENYEAKWKENEIDSQGVPAQEMLGAEKVAEERGTIKPNHHIYITYTV